MAPQLRPEARRLQEHYLLLRNLSFSSQSLKTKSIMKYQIQIFLLFISIGSSHLSYAQSDSPQQTHQMTTSEIQMFTGEWTGTLSYLDYSSGEIYTMPCESIIERKTNKKLSISYSYPNEPNANSKGRIKVSKGGTHINKTRISSKSMTTDGQLTIAAQYHGRDGNDAKPAMIRNIYKVSDQQLTIRKEVKFEGTNDWIVRNDYNFTRR